MEIRPIRHQQFLAKRFRQRFEHHPKSGKAGVFRHFVGQAIRLLGMIPIRLHRLFAIRANVPQVFLHQHLRKEPTHSIHSPQLPLLPFFHWSAKPISKLLSSWYFDRYSLNFANPHSDRHLHNCRTAHLYWCSVNLHTHLQHTLLF